MVLSANNLSYEDKFLENTEAKSFRVILSGIIDAAFLFTLIIFIVRHFVMFSLWDKLAEKSSALLFLLNSVRRRTQVGAGLRPVSALLLLL